MVGLALKRHRARWGDVGQTAEIFTCKFWGSTLTTVSINSIAPVNAAESTP